MREKGADAAVEGPSEKLVVGVEEGNWSVVGKVLPGALFMQKAGDRFGERGRPGARYLEGFVKEEC